jgi:hypothetical protein
MNKHRNDSTHQPHRTRRFTASTKGIRLTPDLQEWVDGELAKEDTEDTFAKLVRDGLRLLRKQREGLIQVLTIAR